MWADSAYTPEMWSIVPFKKPANGQLTADQRTYNYWVSKVSCDEVAAKEVENREENSVGDEASCSFPKVYLYTLWSTCVHNPLRGD